MKRYFYQNNSVGFTKWCKNVPRIQNVVRQYRNAITSAQKSQFKDEYEEAIISHEQYLKLIKILTKEVQDYFHRYLIQNKVPPRDKHIFEIYNKAYFLWRSILFKSPREVVRIDRLKFGKFLKQKRIVCQYSQDDVCTFIGINIVYFELRRRGYEVYVGYEGA